MWVRFWAIVGLILSLFAADAIGVFTAADSWIEARRFALLRSSVDSNIAVVAIDSESIARVGQWPWSRKVHAQIVDKLVALRARQVAFDIDFSSSSPVPGDEDFRHALIAAGGSTILAGFKQISGGQLVDTVPLSKFSDNAWVATVSVTADSDGIIRRLPFNEMLAGQQTPSLAAYLSQSHSSELEEINIDFAVSSSSFQQISAIDLLQDRVPASLIAGKDVVVGATAVELRDLFVTPTGEIVPGSVLQALAAETAKLERSIVTPGLLVRVLGICFIGLWGLLVTRRQWVTQLCLFGTGIAAVELTALVLQWTHHISMPTTSWVLALVGLAAASTASELGFRKFKIGSIQKRLGATKALLQEVIADSPAGVIVIDDNNIVRVANLAAQHILELSKPDCVGLLATDAFPPALAHLFEVPLNASPEPQQGELRLQLTRSVKILEYSLTRSTVANDEGGVAFASARCLTFQDVTERHQHIQHLSYLALHDKQTGSRNRNSFIQDLESFAARGKHVTVVHMGIDRFKYVNEDFGHDVGDQLLSALVKHSKALLDDGQQLYRVAGDEFACILVHQSDALAADKIAQSMLALGGTIQLGPYEVRFSLSVGVADSVEDGRRADEIIRRSGLALVAAKDNGGNNLCVFNSKLDEAASRRKLLESALPGALEREEFHLLYQPQFDLASGRCVGVESLLRWTSPTLGMVSPKEFIPVAEQIGMIEDIGGWVLQQACCDIAGISNNIVVAVNVSAQQFMRGNLAQPVANALAVSGLPPNRLEIEITESIFAESTPGIVETLQDLRSSGVVIALDDFGTGYSSLSYLLNLPLDKIKIDKSFITSLPNDPKAGAILGSILGVAKGLGLTVIAEGVETAAQSEALKDAGCHQGQGYLFAKPLGPEALAVFLQILGLGGKDHKEISLSQAGAGNAADADPLPPQKKSA